MHFYLQQNAPYAKALSRPVSKTTRKKSSLVMASKIAIAVTSLPLTRQFLQFDLNSMPLQLVNVVDSQKLNHTKDNILGPRSLPDNTKLQLRKMQNIVTIMCRDRRTPNT